MGLALLNSGMSLQTGMVGHPPSTREDRWALRDNSYARTIEYVTHTGQLGFEQPCYGTLAEHSEYIRSFSLAGVVEQ